MCSSFILVKDYTLMIGQLWTPLVNCLLQIVQITTVFNQINCLARQQKLVIDIALPIPPATEHNFLGMYIGFWGGILVVIPVSQISYAGRALQGSWRKVFEGSNGPYAPFGFESIKKQLWRNKQNDRPISDSEIKAAPSQLFKTDQWLPPAGHVSEDVTSHA
ncbi:hypothetical protein AVEN_187598-1 [Araneus ventricosus]|uniref:Uncharacterized protein n=1 Tax=Araneus ventricosus TaxID=182803 RepID=A0A4Y2TZE6_ARAVE|nr:hypothetical protein AVEN_187598-1 [Araneus ventricosus]